MESLKRFWAWFAGLFNKDVFEEVPTEVDNAETPPVEKPKEPALPKLPEDLIFSCADGSPVPQDYYSSASLLATNLRTLARELGEPLVLVSVYRSAPYNKRVGGLDNSAHLTCAAADFSVSESSFEDVVNKIGELMESGKMSPGTVAINPGYIHYEII